MRQLAILSVAIFFVLLGGVSVHAYPAIPDEIGRVPIPSPTPLLTATPIPLPTPQTSLSPTIVRTSENGMNCEEGWTQPNLRFDDYDLFHVLPNRKQALAEGYIARDADHPVGIWYLFRWPEEEHYRLVYTASARQKKHQKGHDREWAGKPWLAEIDERTWGDRDLNRAQWGVLCSLPETFVVVGTDAHIVGSTKVRHATADETP